MSFKIVIRALILIILCVGIPATAASFVIEGGQTRYLAPTGADAGDCTNMSEPCLSLNYARLQSDPGDTIQLSEGTFHDSVNLFTDLTIRGAGVDKTFIDGGATGRVFAIQNGSVHIEQLTIQNGDAGANLNGGGVVNWSTLSLDQVVLQHNHAPNHGGGLYNGGVLTMTHTTIYSNTSNNTSAGLINFGTATISHSTLHANKIMSGNNYGGGLHNNGSANMTLTNVTISANSGPSGGGISNSGMLDLRNVTIVDNVVTNNFGSGISNYGSIDIRNSVIANNSGADQCEGSANPISHGHNLESTNSCGFGEGSDLPSTSAGLRPIANYGGQTKTHMPLLDSPLIDAGDNISCPDVDQRDRVRPVDGDDVVGAICDIGAVEFDPAFDQFRTLIPIAIVGSE